MTGSLRELLAEASTWPASARAKNDTETRDSLLAEEIRRFEERGVKVTRAFITTDEESRLVVHVLNGSRSIRADIWREAKTGQTRIKVTKPISGEKLRLPETREELADLIEQMVLALTNKARQYA